ncbi:hypothetical protein DV706_01860 [Natronorubrum bangense]|uniref:Uncharacterized protein n=1 Tax=Natronorubrum bangense TaxID=61858 RepID=A0A4D6HII1_9EURY|nr:hypothetical protein DV706_01860 [Natronorubrum bangense]
MCADSNNTGAFGDGHLVLMIVIVLALMGTSALFLLGLPVSWLVATFFLLFIGLSVAARPLFTQARPRLNRDQN